MDCGGQTIAIRTVQGLWGSTKERTRSLESGYASRCERLLHPWTSYCLASDNAISPLATLPRGHLSCFYLHRRSLCKTVGSSIYPSLARSITSSRFVARKLTRVRHVDAGLSVLSHRKRTHLIESRSSPAPEIPTIVRRLLQYVLVSAL